MFAGEFFAAVVVAGGAARRVGGATKPALHVGGRTLLGRVLDAVGQAQPRIVVGPPELSAILASDVILTREHPAGGGPVAAIAAGLSFLAQADPDTHLAVLASDLPFLTPSVVHALRAPLPTVASGTALIDDAARVDGVVLGDEAGRPQWLAGVWRLGALSDRLTFLGDPAGRSMRDLVSGLRVDRIRLTDLAGPPPWFDCDTEDDLRQAEEWARGDTG